jgi:hypothetical protein
MKKFVLLLGLLFAMQTALMAQDTTGTVVFNAHLLSTFNLNVDGVDQEITFANAAQYNTGVTEGAGIAPGFTLISVEATGNWELKINCPDFLPYAGPNGPGTGTIPINNLGVYVIATGGNTFTGGEVTCAYQSAAAALGLDNADQPLIGLGSGNGGDITDNAFTLHWLMGTKQGTMESTSMFDQMALTPPVFGVGDFTTTAILTLHAL